MIKSEAIIVQLDAKIKKMRAKTNSDKKLLIEMADDMPKILPCCLT